MQFGQLPSPIYIFLAQFDHFYPESELKIISIKSISYRQENSSHPWLYQLGKEADQWVEQDWRWLEIGSQCPPKLMMSFMNSPLFTLLFEYMGTFYVTFVTVWTPVESSFYEIFSQFGLLQSPVSSRSRTVSSSGLVPNEDTRKRARTSRWCIPPFTHSILFNVATNLVLSFLVQCPGHQNQNIYLLLFINEDFILWNFIVMVNKPFSSVAEDGLLKKRRLRNIEENWDRQQAERRFKEQSSESKGCYAVHSTPSEDSMHHSATVHPNPPRTEIGNKLRRFKEHCELSQKLWNIQ